MHVEARRTALGTLELWCASTEGQHRWRLEFQLRDTPLLMDEADAAAPSGAELSVTPAQLEAALAHYRCRLLVRPGLTGLAQVQLPPDSDMDSVRRKLAHDLHYVQHHHFRMDVQILLATLAYLGKIPGAGIRKLLGLPGF